MVRRAKTYVCVLTSVLCDSVSPERPVPGVNCPAVRHQGHGSHSQVKKRQSIPKDGPGQDTHHTARSGHFHQSHDDTATSFSRMIGPVKISISYFFFCSFPRNETSGVTSNVQPRYKGSGRATEGEQSTPCCHGGGAQPV